MHTYKVDFLFLIAKTKILRFPLSSLLAEACRAHHDSSSRMASKTWPVPQIPFEVRGQCLLRMDLSFRNTPHCS